MVAERPGGKTPQGPELINYLQKRFASLWQKLAEESDPGERDFFLEEYLRDLEERAYLETTIANQYRNRYLVELVQNAVDAMHRHAENQPPATSENDNTPIYRCRIELTGEALYIANDGRPFEAEDVRSITAMGKSTKGAGRYIGYKGLGFRSVLELTDEPEIYSEPFNFKFSRRQTLALLQRQAPELEIGEVPILSVPFGINPDELPESEQAVLRALKAEGFVTIIRLPLKPGLLSEVKANCRDFLTGNSLLFLPYITQLSLKLPSEPLLNLQKRVITLPPLSQKEQPATLEHVSLSLDQSGLSEEWVIARPIEPARIPRELLEGLNDRTWLNLTMAGLAVAFPAKNLPTGGLFLRRRLEPLPFFTHFPTGEMSGFGLAVHADFYLSASRKEIDPGLVYNRWLIKRVVDFICEAALPVVQERFPDEAALPDLLLDIAYHNGPFGHAFRQALDDLLAITSFVPVGGGQYRRPREVVWAPLAGAGVLLFRKVFPVAPDGYRYPVIQLESTYIAEEEGFDYRRIRRFLRDLGVRPVSPEELPGLMPQAYLNLEEGVATVSDVCATLGLWLEQLALETLVPEERQRGLLNIARDLAVLPVGLGWEKPGDEVFDWPATGQGFLALKSRQEFFGPFKVIAEAAYSPVNQEFEPQIRNWHKRLGVKSLDPEPKLFAWKDEDPEDYNY